MTENENNNNPVVTESKYEEFYCCYLLRSLAPNYKQTGYIGSTNDPKRRLRQHNGEIALGAKKTIKRRPWEMILFVYGFPNHVAALQFEWSWQHPSRTRRLHLTNDDDFRENDEKLSSSLCALSKMLQDKFWSRWPLHLHVIIPLETITLNNNNNNIRTYTYTLQQQHHQQQHQQQQQQQQQQQRGKKTVRASILLDVSNLPKKIRVTKGNIEEFNDYHKGTIRKYVRNEYSKYIDQIRNKNNLTNNSNTNSNINSNTNFNNINNTKNINNNYCNLCLENINVNDHKKYLNCLNMECNMVSHLTCLAKNFTKSEALEKSTFQKPYDELEEEILPVSGKCPTCQMILLWGDLIQAMMVREKYVSNDLVINE